MDLDAAELTLDAQPGSRLVVLEAGLEGRQAKPRFTSTRLGDEGLITFVADLPGNGLVRIVDGRTGADLTEVRVIPAAKGQLATTLPPATALADSTSESSPSPVALPSNENSVPYWMGAHGYAWRRIQFGASSGQPEYALWPGGDVRIEARGQSDPAQQLILRIERQSEESGRIELIAEEPLVPDHRLEFRGLPLGPMQALVLWLDAHRARGNAGLPGAVDHQAGVILASRDFIVAAGPPEGLEIDLGALPKAQDWGEISLAVETDDELTASALEACVELVGTDQPVNAVSVALQDMHLGYDGQYHISFSERLPGVHRVSLSPGNVASEVHLSPGAEAEVFLKAPELSKLRLWVLDAASGNPVESVHILWRPVESQGLSTWHRTTSRSTEGPLEFALGAGRVEIAVQAGGFATAKQVFELDPGWNEESIELSRIDAREILVSLRSGEFDLPVSGVTWSGAAATDETGSSRLVAVTPQGMTMRDGSVAETATARLIVNGPGTYQVSIGKVPGFRTPESKQVVVDDSAASVVFDLIREVGAATGR